uniref:Uncharacterized protein n=1 Tax=Arundo donax TaxID=35708 RepID=A0A0A8YLK3_ARUDO
MIAPDFHNNPTRPLHGLGLWID